MKLQLYFEFALHISYYKPDTLVVEFADPDLFEILPEHRRVTRPLMRQLPYYAKSTQEKINSSSDDSKTVTVAIMGANFALGFGLKSVIDMINAL